MTFAAQYSEFLEQRQKEQSGPGPIMTFLNTVKPEPVTCPAFFGPAEA